MGKTSQIYAFGTMATASRQASISKRHLANNVLKRICSEKKMWSKSYTICLRIGLCSGLNQYQYSFLVSGLPFVLIIHGEVNKVNGLLAWLPTTQATNSCSQLLIIYCIKTMNQGKS